ncbi:unnamed protein product [Rotaria socialis]
MVPSVLDEFLSKMNDINFSSKNASTRRIYQRRNRKKNRTDTDDRSGVHYLPLTRTIITTTTANTTLLLNSSSVPINDLFASLSYLTQYKYFFIVGLLFLIFLCVISILFLIFILKCTRRKNGKIRRPGRLNKKQLDKMPDFLEDHTNHTSETAILLAAKDQTKPTNNNLQNGPIANDDISNTFSIDPMTEKKIIDNNPPNSSTLSLSPMVDAISIDTIRGSLISSPSQQISINQQPSTLSNITTTDSKTNSNDRVDETEKDDYLRGLDFKRTVMHYNKASNNSSSNLPIHRTSAPSIEQTIRRQERRAEDEERGFLFGSNSNLYEKELRKAEQAKFARKENTHSQASLVSRTSEDSCY